MSIDVDTFMDDTGGQACTLYGMLQDVIDEGKDMINQGTLLKSAHRLRGALVQLYVSGRIIEHLTGVTPDS